LGHHEKALKDGTDSESLDATYVKGVFRKGLALHAMGRYRDAIETLAAAHKLEPKNKQIKQALQFAEVRMHQEMQKRMDN
jgi:cytochrome c-type biogenesis protein CcmH/NrfG